LSKKCINRAKFRDLYYIRHNRHANHQWQFQKLNAKQLHKKQLERVSEMQQQKLQLAKDQHPEGDDVLQVKRAQQKESEALAEKSEAVNAELLESERQNVDDDVKRLNFLFLIFFIRLFVYDLLVWKFNVSKLEFRNIINL